MLELGDQLIDYNSEINMATGKQYYQSLGYRHVSVDLNGNNGAEVRDLTKPDQFKDFYNQFDIVTNSGTTEHVEPHQAQFDCWKIINDCLRPTGLILCFLPDVDELDQKGLWQGHCSFYYSKNFFDTLAKECGYELLDNYVIANHGHRAAALLKTTNSGFSISAQQLLQNIAIR